MGAEASVQRAHGLRGLRMRHRLWFHVSSVCGASPPSHGIGLLGGSLPGPAHTLARGHPRWPSQSIPGPWLLSKPTTHPCFQLSPSVRVQRGTPRVVGRAHSLETVSAEGGRDGETRGERFLAGWPLGLDIGLNVLLPAAGSTLQKELLPPAHTPVSVSWGTSGGVRACGCPHLL